MSYSLTYSQAVLVLVYVADKVRQGLFDFVPTRVIAASLGIPPPTTAKILHTLGLAGIIETREGAKGGVRLALSASKISLADVLGAMEQKRPLFAAHMHVRAKGERPTRAQAAIRKALDAAEDAMRLRLSETTIEDILAQFGSPRAEA
jgi:Rrf2 family protein